MRGEREVPLHEIPRANRRVRLARANVEAERAEVQLAAAHVSDGVPDAVLDDAQRRDGIAPRPQRVPAGGAEHRGVHVRDERAVAGGPIRGGVFSSSCAPVLSSCAPVSSSCVPLERVVARQRPPADGGDGREPSLEVQRRAHRRGVQHRERGRAHGVERRPENHRRDAPLAVVRSHDHVSHPPERCVGVTAVHDGAAEADEVAVLVEDAGRAGDAAHRGGVAVGVVGGLQEREPFLHAGVE
mmetsp:Transcript_4245/g.15821  ORF Transcript_4245/g.15821 Transcript_4245/m.15821 type:complete len:242 (-) Transcript_4245:400-1125(-)